MPTAKVTKNVSAAIGGGNVMCSTLISIKTKAWLYSCGRVSPKSFTREARVSMPGTSVEFCAGEDEQRMKMAFSQSSILFMMFFF